VTEDTIGLLSAPKWETSQECSCFCPVDPEAINPEESNGAMEDMMTTSSSVMQQVSLTGNDYLLVYNVFSLVVASMFAAFVYFLMNASQVAKQYRNAVVVSAVVVGIAGYHYFRIFSGWSDGQFNEGYRYADWLLTVPLLLIELLIVLGLTSEKRRPLTIRLVIAAVLMIGLGYPGEISTSDSTKWIFWVLAMIPFLYILATLYKEITAATKRESAGVAKALRLALVLLLVAWFVYPIAYLFPIIFGQDSSMAETVRQVGYSVADLLAKPVYGLAILAVAKLRTREEAPTGN
jgi:bacteriorhodopsin